MTETFRPRPSYAGTVASFLTAGYDDTGVRQDLTLVVSVKVRPAHVARLGHEHHAPPECRRLVFQHTALIFVRVARTLPRPALCVHTPGGSPASAQPRPARKHGVEALILRPGFRRRSDRIEESRFLTRLRWLFPSRSVVRALASVLLET